MATYMENQLRDGSGSGLSPAELAHQQALKYGEDLRRVYLAEKAKRQELQLTNQLLSAVFESTPDGLAVLDDNLFIQRANPVFRRYVERPHGRIEGEALEDILPSDMLLTELRALATGRSTQTQFELNIEQPVKRSFAVNVARLKAGQQHHGWVLSLHDQTARKRLEYQKVEFINIAAHELRTPLSSIIGLSELILDSLNEQEIEDDDMVACTEGIHRSGFRLANVVDQLVAFAQLSEGSLQPGGSTRVSISDLILEIMEQLEPRAEEKNVMLFTNFPETEVEVTLDATLLRAALYQIMLNGISFNEPGGTVTITVDRSDEFVVISVADTGIGIPQADLESIFRPFFQVEEHSTRNVGGLGLGLSIVNNAVSQLGGELAVDSRLGEGTTFRMMLPIRYAYATMTLDDMEAKLEETHQQSLRYAEDVRALYNHIQSHFLDTLSAVIESFESQDLYLEGHTARVSQLVGEMAALLNLDERQRRRLMTATCVHDIGKVGAPEEVLYHVEDPALRPQAVREHIERLQTILSPLKFLEDVTPIAVGSHERYNGEGYPDGLAEDDLPIEAQILGLANAYDYLVTPKPDHDPISSDEALATLHDQAGIDWAPDVIAALAGIVGTGV